MDIQSKSTPSSSGSKTYLRYKICLSAATMLVGQTILTPVFAQQANDIAIAAGGGACGHIAPALIADIKAFGVPKIPAKEHAADIDFDMTWQSFNPSTAKFSIDLANSLQRVLDETQKRSFKQQITPEVSFKLEESSRSDFLLKDYDPSNGQIIGQWTPNIGSRVVVPVQEFVNPIDQIVGLGQMPISNDFGTGFGSEKIQIPVPSEHGSLINEILDNHSVTYNMARKPTYEAAFLAMAVPTLRAYKTRKQEADPSMVAVHTSDMLAKMPPEFAPVAYASLFDNPDYGVYACGGEPTTPTPIPVIIPKIGGGVEGVDCAGWRKHLPICTDPLFFNGVGGSGQSGNIVGDFNPLPNRDNVELRLNYAAEVSPDGFLTTLALKRRNGVTVCSGVLVDNRYVLSAAHCFCEGEKPLNAVFGTSAAKSNHDRFGDFRGEIQLSDQIILKNKDYCSQYNNWKVTGRKKPAPHWDLVLLRTDSRLPPSIAYAMLPTEPLWSDESYQDAKIVGFGANDNSDFSGTKHSASIAIDPDGCSNGELASECHKGEEFTATSDALKANSDSCFADSGAPVFIKQGGFQYLAGIVSRGTSKNQIGKCGKGGIYADLRNKNIRKWLTEQTRQKQGAP